MPPLLWSSSPCRAELPYEHDEQDRGINGGDPPRGERAVYAAKARAAGADCAVKSAFWAAHSWQRVLGLPAPDCDYRPRGERPCVPAARLAGWLLVDQVQPVRCMRGAPSKERRGWAVQPIPWRASAARRPGAKRRPEASGIKAAWPRLGTRRGATPASPTAARRDALLFTTKCK